MSETAIDYAALARTLHSEPLAAEIARLRAENARLSLEWGQMEQVASCEQAEAERLLAENARLREVIVAAHKKAARHLDELPDDAPQEVVIDICFHPLLDLIAALQTLPAPGSTEAT